MRTEASMAPHTLRFVHASDLHIDRPLYGLDEAPDELRELLRDAPMQSAERVFDTTLTENADGLLLSGNVIDLKNASPRSVMFLVDQFKRLEKRNIPVFWAGGVLDPPSAWPRSLPLPSNVTVFPGGNITSHEVYRDGAVIACVMGTSLAEGHKADTSSFHHDAHGRYTIGVAFGTNDEPGKEGDRVDYMALGGRKRRATVDHEPGIAHYPGSPQGRSPNEVGPSGCTILQVEEDGKAKTRFVATDMIRWQEETVEFTVGVTPEQLRTRLRERLDKVRAKAKGTDQLIAWRLEGVGPLTLELRDEGLCRELLVDLQQYAGRTQPICWSYRMTCDDPYEPPHEQRDQETILGDLLRQVEVLRHNEAFVLDLGEMLPKPMPLGELSEIAKQGDADDRVHVINQAAKLGVALMSAEE